MCDERMIHLQCAYGEIGSYVFLPGDPGRVSMIAASLEDAHPVANNREFVTWTGKLEGVPVSVISTGIGGPSAVIALEEAVKLGAHTFIRVGTCGAIAETLEPGTLLLPVGAVRSEGTSNEYLPPAFPAVPDLDTLCALREAARSLGKPFQTGVVQCKDSYYGQHEPDQMPVADKLHSEWNAWKRGGALGSEMESAALFIAASVRRVRCATVLLLARNREREAAYNLPVSRASNIEDAIAVAVAAMRIRIRIDKGEQRL